MNEEKQKQLESIADRLLEKAAEMNSLANEIYRLIGSSCTDGLEESVPTLKEYTKIVVETEEENSKTIASITADDIDPSEGFRVRMTPRYD